jgi:hypothetical protein
MSGAAAPSPTTAGRSWVRTYLPPQHGAWAMLVAPFLLGTLASSWTWLAAPLLVAWVDGYLLSYYVLQWVKTRRRQRVAAPLRLYGLLLLPLAVLLVLAEPWLVLAGVAFLPFTAVNAWYARRRDERALVNGLVSVTQACLMVPVAYGVGGGDDWRRAAVLYAAAWLYFAGTVFYVKTMIREKGDPAHLRWSVGFHAVAVVAAAALDPWLVGPFALFLLRAVAMPRRAASRPVRPAQVGALEVVNTVLLVVVALASTAP